MGRPKGSKNAKTLSQTERNRKGLNMKPDIKEAKYLWNNRAGHDKVYGLFTIGKAMVKVWGRRSSNLRFEQIENASIGLFAKTLQEKVGKGYDEVASTDPTKTKIIKDINSVLDNFVFDSPTVNPLDKMTQSKVAPAVAKPQTAICIDNTGIAQFFDKGVEYFYIKQVNDAMIVVEDAIGTERMVLKERFKLK